MKEYGQRTTVVLGYMLPPKIWVPIILQRLQEVVSHAHVQGKFPEILSDKTMDDKLIYSSEKIDV